MTLTTFLSGFDASLLKIVEMQPSMLWTNRHHCHFVIERLNMDDFGQNHIKMKPIVLVLFNLIVTTTNAFKSPYSGKNKWDIFQCFADDTKNFNLQ